MTHDRVATLEHDVAQLRRLVLALAEHVGIEEPSDVLDTEADEPMLTDVQVEPDESGSWATVTDLVSGRSIRANGARQIEEAVRRLEAGEE